ncbi:uncharacterized protein [Rutidosis leptorrhynchoides]|uniref:uncharacterized protein n=1 Tax=Rutidosis leptorrhynchoides TaxID=125765 RepID=UPI003A99D496
MKILVSKCPGCLEITYGNGRNILHFAIENKKLEVVKFMFSCELFTSLINKRDGDGNTPIHLFMKSNCEMIEIILDSRVNMNTLNNENRSPLDVSSSEEKRERLLKGIINVRGIGNQSRVLFPEVDNASSFYKGYVIKPVIQKDDERKLEEFKAEFELSFKVVENLVLVATLIATATFAGIYSVPGGFDGNEGSNQGLAMITMAVAFVTGIYVVLTPSIVILYLDPMLLDIVMDHKSNKMLQGD